MQYAFPFYEDLQPRPKYPERLFFALLLNADTADRVDRFRREFFRDHDLRGKPLETSRLHVSLHHVGDYKRLRSKHVFAAKRAGQSVSMPQVEAIFHSVMSFDSAPSRFRKSGKRPLVLLGQGHPLFELHDLLGAAMQANGLRAADSFVPHITLSYDPQPVRLQPVDPIPFVSREIVLIHSELWLTRYNILGRWPLSA